MVPDPQKREILNDLGEVAKTLIQSESAIETITKLEKRTSQSFKDVDK
tara:strand:- start:985 stop:1128 length:144 start_codon:yes stop_codon:yes gene_type:complete